jgi:uncharacterized membrane protein
MEGNFGKAKGVLLALIGLAYVIMGITVAIKHWFLVKIDEKPAWALGTILILYGIFRIYRAINTIKKGSL